MQWTWILTLLMFAPSSFAGADFIIKNVDHPRQGQKYPVLLVFGGFESAGQVLELVRPPRPTILASFDYPFKGQKVYDFPRESFKFLGDIPKMRDAVKDTSLGITELIAHLKTLPYVDPDRIAILGASFGAPFAIEAAATHPELKYLVIVHGFANVGDAARDIVVKSGQKSLGVFIRPLAWLAGWLVTNYLRAPEPSEFAQRLGSQQMVYAVEAADDEFIAPVNRKKLFTSLEQSKASVKHVVMPGNHLLPGSDKLIETITSMATEWLQQNGFY